MQGRGRGRYSRQTRTVNAWPVRVESEVVAMISVPGWLTYICPPLGRGLFMFVVIFALAGSAAKIFCLIMFGVNEEEFRAVEAAVET